MLQEEKDWDGGAFCHFPIHGIRLYRGEELIFQTSICVLLFAPNAKTMRPIVFGLFGVIGLNGTTESIFQSFVAVQFYTLVVLIFARAAFAPDHK